MYEFVDDKMFNYGRVFSATYEPEPERISYTHEPW